MKRACVLVIFVCAACGRGPRAAPARPEAALAPKAARPAYEDRLLLTGELVAKRTVDLFAPETPVWQVQVRWMEADGATVTKGQRVIELDSSSFTAQLEEKTAAAQQAAADLVKQEADSEGQVADKAFALEKCRTAVEKARVDAAVPEELRPRREHQEKQLALKKAESELAKAGEDLAAARRGAAADIALKKLTLAAARREAETVEAATHALSLVAPADGVFVVSDHPRERRKIQVGDSVWPGFALARIPDRSGMQVEAALFDVDDGLVTKGTPVIVTLDADPGRPLKGTVSETAAIAQEPTRESLRRTLRVAVILEKPEDVPMRPGQSVKVEVRLHRVEVLAEGAAPKAGESVQ
jgi:hypothetical protein